MPPRFSALGLDRGIIAGPLGEAARGPGELLKVAEGPELLEGVAVDPSSWTAAERDGSTPRSWTGAVHVAIMPAA
jgi:hypothetical protein